MPPDYDGPLPEGGFYIAHSQTNLVVVLGRMFLENNDPQPVVELFKNRTKIYPYEAGGAGTSVAKFLQGKINISDVTSAPPTVFHEGSGEVMNTIPPNDFSFYEVLNDVVQQEPLKVFSRRKASGGLERKSLRVVRARNQRGGRAAAGFLTQTLVRRCDSLLKNPELPG